MKKYEDLKKALRAIDWYCTEESYNEEEKYTEEMSEEYQKELKEREREYRLMQL